MSEPVLALHGAARIISFPDNTLLRILIGPLNCHLKQLEDHLDVSIDLLGNQLTLKGDKHSTQQGAQVLQAIYERLEQGKPLDSTDIDALLRFQQSAGRQDAQIEMFYTKHIEIRTRKKTVETRTPAQTAYVKQLFDQELVFGLGSAGTGKTYLAVAVAVSKFIHGHVDKIILSRPAVEAGERLGFLPGDMKDKVDPYMQPLYDALYDFLPATQVTKWVEEKKIEIAPLAFMRGRTLSHAFIVLDEAQNVTTMQMKMFLTRMGQGARMAITGDTSQIDLPKAVPSGLVEACDILKDVPGIGFTQFQVDDVVRHPMVTKVIKAYDSAKKRNTHGG